MGNLLKYFCILLLLPFGAQATVYNWTNGVNLTQYLPGDTVNLWGTNTSTWEITNNGTAGNIITFNFQPGLKFIAGAWLPAIHHTNASYITIDGLFNGLIENTNNGMGLGLTNNTTGILIDNGWNYTIQHVTMTNLYHEIPGASDGNEIGLGISANGSGVNILQNLITDCSAPIAWSYNLTVQSNVNIIGNTNLNMNHGITIGNGDTLNRFAYNINVTSNLIDHFDTWDSTNSANHHLDGIIVFNNSSDPSVCVSNLNFNANVVGPHIGSHFSTAAFFVNVFGTFCAKEFHVYDNLFWAISPGTWANGFISIGPGFTNSWFANNTFMSYSNKNTAIAIGGNSMVFFGSLWITNNLAFNCGTGISEGASDITDPMNHVFSDNNVWYGVINNNTGAFIETANRFTDFGGWQNNTGNDVHSTTNFPSLDSNFIPTSGDTVAKGQGKNLSPFFTTDILGFTRPAPTTPWDIGAFTSGYVPPAPVNRLMRVTNLHVGRSYTGP